MHGHLLVFHAGCVQKVTGDKENSCTCLVSVNPVIEVILTACQLGRSNYGDGINSVAHRPGVEQAMGPGGPLPPRFRCNGARLDLCPPPLSDGITVYGAAEIR